MTPNEFAGKVDSRPEPTWLTEAEAAEYMRISRKTLEKYRLAGTGPRCSYSGSKPVYRREWLDEWLEDRTTPVVRTERQRRREERARKEAAAIGDRLLLLSRTMPPLFPPADALNLERTRRKLERCLSFLNQKGRVCRRRVGDLLTATRVSLKVLARLRRRYPREFEQIATLEGLAGENPELSIESPGLLR